MATISFEVTDAEARAVEAWSGQLGVAPSALLRDALRRQLLRLASGPDAGSPEAAPLSPQEQAVADAADWGAEEDWSDWAEAAGGRP